MLKPNDDYGGRGIVLGWLVSDDEWQATLRTALEAPYVVQERIVLPTEPFPSWVDGGVQVTDRMIDIAPYVTETAQVDGCLTRIATDPLLNVTAGGGSAACRRSWWRSGRRMEEPAALRARFGYPPERPCATVDGERYRAAQMSVTGQGFGDFRRTPREFRGRSTRSELPVAFLLEMMEREHPEYVADASQISRSGRAVRAGPARAAAGPRPADMLADPVLLPMVLAYLRPRPAGAAGWATGSRRSGRDGWPTASRTARSRTTPW